MKLFHLSDLHIGKIVNKFSMIEDQIYIFNRITELIKEHKPDGVIIAGDVYDKSIPSAEAVSLFDDFLTELSHCGTAVYLISGNHDSAERIAYAQSILKRNDIYISPVYDGIVEPVSVRDEFGEINIYLMPFIKLFNVRQAFPEENIESYNDAFRVAVEKMEVDTSKRNILVAHQFVTGSEGSGSEDAVVGAVDNVDSDIFNDFDYVALGHIHGAQHIGRKTVRYCGTPLKYSFSECRHKKSVTMLDIGTKGEEIKITELPLVPMRDMREMTGSFEELFEEGKNNPSDDYLRIVLTDTDRIPDAIGGLRPFYPNIMILEYAIDREKYDGITETVINTERYSPMELFSKFFNIQNGRDMEEDQRELMEELINEIWTG